MSKFFDIRPPSRSPQKTKKYKKKNRSYKKSKNNGLLFVIVGVCIFIFIFSLTNNTSSTYDQPDQITDSSKSNDLIDTNKKTIPSPNPDTTSSSNPEKVIDNEQIEETKVDKKDSDADIVILNGARIPGIASEVKNTLENNNIEVSELGNTENTYDSTIIYYTENNTDTANKIQETLSEYDPKLEIDPSIANEDKIVVVIGINQ